MSILCKNCRKYLYVDEYVVDTRKKIRDYKIKRVKRCNPLAIEKYANIIQRMKEYVEKRLRNYEKYMDETLDWAVWFAAVAARESNCKYKYNHRTGACGSWQILRYNIKRIHKKLFNEETSPNINKHWCMDDENTWKYVAELTISMFLETVNSLKRTQGKDIKVTPTEMFTKWFSGKVITDEKEFHRIAHNNVSIYSYVMSSIEIYKALYKELYGGTSLINEANLYRFLKKDKIKTAEIATPPETTTVKTASVTPTSTSHNFFENMLLLDLIQYGPFKTKKDFTSFRIGLVSLEVPPTDIRISYVDSFREAQTIRSVSSVKIPTKRSELVFSLNIIFPDIESINNLARVIISQFRRAPFINIDSPYLKYLLLSGFSLYFTEKEGYTNLINIELTDEEKKKLVENKNIHDLFLKAAKALKDAYSIPEEYYTELKKAMPSIDDMTLKSILTWIRKSGDIPIFKKEWIDWDKISLYVTMDAMSISMNTNNPDTMVMALDLRLFNFLPYTDEFEYIATDLDAVLQQAYVNGVARGDINVKEEDYRPLTVKDPRYSVPFIKYIYAPFTEYKGRLNEEYGVLGQIKKLMETYSVYYNDLQELIDGNYSKYPFIEGIVTQINPNLAKPYVYESRFNISPMVGRQGGPRSSDIIVLRTYYSTRSDFDVLIHNIDELYEEYKLYADFIEIFKSREINIEFLKKLWGQTIIPFWQKTILKLSIFKHSKDVIIKYIKDNFNEKMAIKFIFTKPSTEKGRKITKEIEIYVADTDSFYRFIDEYEKILNENFVFTKMVILYYSEPNKKVVVTDSDTLFTTLIDEMPEVNLDGKKYDKRKILFELIKDYKKFIDNTLLIANYLVNEVTFINLSEYSYTYKAYDPFLKRIIERKIDPIVDKSKGEFLTLTNIIANIQNSFVYIPITQYDIPTAQHIGSADWHITLQYQTNSMRVVEALQRFKKMTTRAVSLGLKYVKNLFNVFDPAATIINNTCFLKVLGINKVMIGNVQIETVREQPGLFNISVELIQADNEMVNLENLRSYSFLKPEVLFILFNWIMHEAEALYHSMGYEMKKVNPDPKDDEYAKYLESLLRAMQARYGRFIGFNEWFKLLDLAVRYYYLQEFVPQVESRVTPPGLMGSPETIIKQKGGAYVPPPTDGEIYPPYENQP